ncbi:Xylogalacturonan beta-1,3-xylosyltransferase [Thalictrum thalictroides]|uniref:Xylogalacturonan beta-1,3-xylosyltransferase n=1 Tax=Thalictrum thalictroides TaxID=46969 RepID=A0A7J6WUT8_THATH|nr:Xylogalacturonan beta-1,3-xylosyltransferase [Thalictrum thalictroides]
MEVSHGLKVFSLYLFLFLCTIYFFSSNQLQKTQFVRSSVSPDISSALYRSFITIGSVEENRFRNPTSVRRVGKLSDAEKLEMGLAKARLAIRSAVKLNISASDDDEDAPRGVVYRNPIAFYQSYLEMEKRFKIYVYEEGDRPIVHGGPNKNIYTSEGRFIHEMELENTKFKTRDARHAHVYFMPFSVSMMVKYLYKPNSNDKSPLLRFVSDYVRVISTKYPFWNKTQGADHFMLSCHDWGPDSSLGNPLLYKNSIRVLCNANTSEGFNPRKDATLPEIYLYDGNMSPDLISIPPDNAPRPHLAFFAGGLHGPIRPKLFQHWKAKDPDIIVYEYLPKNLKYYPFMLQSKFCLCPSGYEVASPRIVEAIYAQCVPVLLSEHYVPPFSDILRWEAFSVQVNVSDIPNLKEILNAIPEEQYRKLKEGVKAVKKHFMLNQPPKRFDVFHMILHSIWIRRLNVQLR